MIPTRLALAYLKFSSISISPADCVGSELSLNSGPYQSASISRKSTLFADAKSISRLCEEVFSPYSKPSGAIYPHTRQSHIDTPGFIHDVSSILLGGFRFWSKLLSTKLPGRLPTMMTRHDVSMPVCPLDGPCKSHWKVLALLVARFILKLVKS